MGRFCFVVVHIPAHACASKPLILVDIMLHSLYIFKAILMEASRNSKTLNPIQLFKKIAHILWKHIMGVQERVLHMAMELLGFLDED